MDDLRFPIGRFDPEVQATDGDLAFFIEEIAETPNRLRAAVAGLTAEQLDVPYRPGGWTVRQVVHHLPDSHMNAYVRFKIALTEDWPTVKTYDEAKWAVLEDSFRAPVEFSLTLLESLHARWVVLLRTFRSEDYVRGFHHPELGEIHLGSLLALYAWHGRHHVAHIASLRERMGW